MSVLDSASVYADSGNLLQTDDIDGLSSGGGGGHGGTGTFQLYFFLFLLNIPKGGGVGGIAHDSVYAPTRVGGHGGTSGTYGIDGAGGGTIKLNVTQTLTIGGTISANGGKGTTTVGGGAGGAVWITCSIMEGKGSILANGGAAGVGSGRYYIY